jgi:hypothetical protein
MEQKTMAIPIPLVPAGARVRVRRGVLPADAALLGLTGTVVSASEYQTNAYGVVLDGEKETRMFSPTELEVVEAEALPPEREAAKQRRALP